MQVFLVHYVYLWEGIILGLGFILTGELAIPIGFHFAWNFFQGNIFGFTVSGDIPSSVSLIGAKLNGPLFWVGDLFGPESGMLAIIAVTIGCLLIIAWIKYRYKNVVFFSAIAQTQHGKSNKQLS